MTRPEVRAQLDGLRGLAVLLVVAGAARLGIPGGFVGVDVGLVIAGYSVTAAVLGRADDAHLSLLDLLARGARRLLPLASLGVVGAIVAAGVLLGPTQLLAVARDARAAALLGMNWVVASRDVNVIRPGRDPSLLLHYWAIAAGVQILVVWTCLLVLTLRSGRSGRATRRAATLVSALSLVSFAWGVTQAISQPVAAFVSPLTRAWEVGAGALVALLAPEVLRLAAYARPLGRWVGLGAIWAAAIGFDAQTPVPGVPALVPVLGAVCVIGSRLRAPASANYRPSAKKPRHEEPVASVPIRRPPPHERKVVPRSDPDARRRLVVALISLSTALGVGVSLAVILATVLFTVILHGLG